MRVYVSSIAWRSFETANVLSLHDLLTDQRFSWHPESNDALLERARARSATRFLEQTDDDVFLSIDSDIVFKDADAVAVCEQAMTRDLVCGIYVTRSRTTARPAAHLKLDQPVWFGLDPTPVPIQWAATGFLAVHRRVFERLAEDPELPVLHPRDPAFRMIPFYSPSASVPCWTLNDAGDPIFLSEDWLFCQRAIRAGFTVSCNPAVRLGHVGTTTFTLEDLYAPLPPAAPLGITRTTQGLQVQHPTIPGR